MAKATANTKTKSKKLAFSVGDFVVYPTHGVGEVVDVATEEIAGF
jgi:CarD family transcriptional regulator